MTLLDGSLKTGRGGPGACGSQRLLLKKCPGPYVRKRAASAEVTPKPCSLLPPARLYDRPLCLLRPKPPNLLEPLHAPLGPEPPPPSPPKP